jgi:oxalate decarboxylase/phosphoglucose isomerase-like protein (cupin superfamily)
MKTYNIYTNHGQAGLGSFEDSRGTITDIFYTANMNHGCIITNQPGAVRGNHYHKFTTQYTYILSGTLTYYSKGAGDGAATNAFEAVTGDMIISEPLEIHAMRAGNSGCTFIAFAEGPRGGADYETDTYRVEDITAVQ